MKKYLLLSWLLLFLPSSLLAEPFGDPELFYNERIVRMQQETDLAVHWLQTNGYDDRVAYQFVLRCGILRMSRGGYDWCSSFDSHRRMIGFSYARGSIKTRHLVKSYLMLDWYR